MKGFPSVLLDPQGFLAAALGVTGGRGRGEQVPSRQHGHYLHQSSSARTGFRY